MLKRHAAIWLLILAGWSLQTVRSQGILIQDSFEGYIAGEHLCTQAPTYWSTWNNGPGTAEDPLVSDSIASDGNNSLHITGTNDALLRLQDQSTGRFRVSFFVFIPNGHTGYYGLLRKFVGVSSEWGLNCYFDANRNGSIETGDPAATGSFIYAYNQWFNVTNIIDLDNDHAEIYVDSNLVCEFTWSATGAGNHGSRTLDALDLFAWSGTQQVSGAFFDDIRFDQLPALPAPSDLQAAVSSDTVTLSWVAPDTTGISGYRIYRDSVVLADLVTGVTYVDGGVYPGTHTYSVKAVYASGMSPEAGPVTAIVAGGMPRSYVLLEIATGTWCTYCPGAALGADDLVKNGKQAAVIEYHASDPYENAASVARNSYYQVPGYPTAQFDGGLTYAGGSAVQSMYPYYLPLYDQRIAKRSLFGLAVSVDRLSERELYVNVTASKAYSYDHNALRLRLALTESHIPQQWQGFMEEVNDVCRAMYPNASGTLLDFGTDTSFTNGFSVIIDSSWTVSQCALTAFLQDDLTKEVLQCTRMEIYSMGIVGEDPLSFTLFPNPATEIVNIRADFKIKQLILYDLSGRVVRSFSSDAAVISINVNGLDPGLYMLRIGDGERWAERKVMIIN